MANTYTLIASNVLTVDTASVTFSAIPATYTDLALRVSARSSAATQYEIQLRPNSITTNYSLTAISGFSSSANSSRSIFGQEFYGTGVVPSSSTANTFSSIEFYLPNYASSDFKLASQFGVSENNAASTNTWISAHANLNRNTAAITSLLVFQLTGNFVSGSSFYLYGIKST
jgi:hypothetical protein